MKKPINFPIEENTRLDREIQKVMEKEFPVPEQVADAQRAAFARIRHMEAAKRDHREQKCIRKTVLKTFAGAAAAAAVFLGICMVNPAFAAQIPLVGHVFEAVGGTMGFSGDYREYVEPLKDTEAAETADGSGDTLLYRQTKDGVTITLSEIYCNDAALYISMVIESEKQLPQTIAMDNGQSVLDLYESTLTFDYNNQECLLASGTSGLEGRYADDHTYAGVLRFDLDAAADEAAYEEYRRKQDEFIQSLGITAQELEENPVQAYEKAREILGIDQITDAALAQAGGADLKDFQKEAKVPETFGVKLTIPMVVGYQVDGKLPEMPEDIRAGYEQAMRDQGLETTDEAYESFTQEQKEIEHQLFNEMWNQYGERFPETREHPNQYENWWVEGPWEFSFQVNKNSGGTVVKEINDVDENGLGLVSVTKTPFEIIIDDGNESADYFTVALDADGDILGNGIGGNTNTLAIQDRDVSKIDVYICDYMEYMDELKGYYWSEDYETKKKEKTFAQLLDERALYHKEIVFEN